MAVISLTLVSIPVKGAQDLVPTIKQTHKVSSKAKIDRAIQQAAKTYGVDPWLIESMVEAESQFDPEARSSEGAEGPMQLLPNTAKAMGAKNPKDITQNIMAGTKYLQQMLDRFDGKLSHALAAYNAGPAAVRKYDGIPPYPETEKYVEKVLGSYQGKRESAQNQAPQPIIPETEEERHVQRDNTDTGQQLPE